MKPVLPFIISVCRPHILFVLAGLIIGGVVGFLVVKYSTVIYQAEGSFVINELPFGIREDTTTPDAETARQFVQSLVLSVSGQEMRHQVAQDLNIPATDLAFSDHDLALDLNNHTPERANIDMTVTRNSRTVEVTAQTTDRDFGVQVVDKILDEIKILNHISGRLEKINFRLKLNREEITNLIQELSTLTEDRIKSETQKKALDSYVQNKWSLDNFPGFSADPTLSNLKTQMILVQSEYASLSAQGTGGDKLLGKKGEMNNLRSQIDTLTDGLSKAMRTSLQIAETRESSLRDQLATLESSNSHLEQLRATLSKGIGDFNIVNELDKTDPDLKGEASVIQVVDQAYSVPKPIWPKTTVVIPISLLAGFVIGLGLSNLRLQLRYLSPAKGPLPVSTLNNTNY